VIRGSNTLLGSNVSSVPTYSLEPQVRLPHNGDGRGWRSMCHCARRCTLSLEHHVFDQVAIDNKYHSCQVRENVRKYELEEKEREAKESPGMCA